MGRMNSATLRAACDELREQFRPYELLDTLNQFNYVTPAEAARRAREEATAQADARTREVIGNLLQNAMLNGGQQNNGLMALMGPGMGVLRFDVGAPGRDSVFISCSRYFVPDWIL